VLSCGDKFEYDDDDDADDVDDNDAFDSKKRRVWLGRRDA